MKRDHTTIKARIIKLGLMKRHVAMKSDVPYTKMSKLITGERTNKEQVEKIHKYLDTVKT